MKKRSKSVRDVSEANAVVDSSRKASMVFDAAKRKKQQKTHLALWSQVVIVVLGAFILHFITYSSIHADENFSVRDAETDHNANDTIDAFFNWFRRSGGVSSKIGITRFPSMGNGILALEDVKESDVVLLVPKELIICQDTILRSIPENLRTKFAKLEHQSVELLTAFLILEQVKKKESFWHPYIQILPSIQDKSDIMSPLFFVSDSDVLLLQDDQMINMSIHERKQTKRAFQRFRRLFRSVLATYAPIDYNDYAWMRFLVNSRAFTIQGQRYLVPFGDIFNGQSHTTTRTFNNGQHFLKYHHLLPNGGMEIRADRSTAADHQVMEDYGDNSNYIYFLYHGFLMSKNPFDCTYIQLSPLQDNDETKMKVLDHFGVENGPRICVSRDGRGDEMHILRFYASLYVMDAHEMRFCGQQQHYQNCFLSATSALSEKEQFNFILSAIDSQLEAYPTTFEEDTRALTDARAGSNEYYAILFRITRKQILYEAKQYIQIQLQSHIQEDSLRKAAQIDQPGTQTSTRNDKLQRFQAWIARQNFPINHLDLAYVNDVMGFGTFATKSLELGEIYLSVPVQVVMNVQSAIKSSSLRQIVRQIGRHQVDDTLLLILHLLDEKFGPNNNRSRWQPYLDMLPDLESSTSHIMSPLFYDEQTHMTLLRGTDLYDRVRKYRHRVQQLYQLLHKNVDTRESSRDINHQVEWITEQRFRWAHAMLDSRSIWWGGQRHLVPLLDMVNCMQRASYHSPHHTVLDSTGEHAITKASWQFAKDDQVVENYGQPNYIYLLYHGFVLPQGENEYDCAHFHVEILKQPAHELPQQAKRMLMEMLEVMGLYSWTPDLCIDSNKDESVKQLVQVAWMAKNPELAAKTQSADTFKLQVAAAKELVGDRITSLEARLSLVEPAPSDSRSQTILTYISQQLIHMRTLQSKLNFLE